MRVQFKMEGGVAFFPGLSRPTIFDTEQLSPGYAAELEQKVKAARFFDLPATVGAPGKGAADYRQYTVTVEDQDRSHTVRVVEPVADSALLALLDYLRARSRARPASG
ncbi:MAG: hypothetical protein FJ316_02290 [SAR202 cluster bacterium]|nr:hypothetical protein [SAR202 cluster bacterium]